MNSLCFTYIDWGRPNFLFCVLDMVHAASSRCEYNPSGLASFCCNYDLGDISRMQYRVRSSSKKHQEKQQEQQEQQKPASNSSSGTKHHHLVNKAGWAVCMGISPTVVCSHVSWRSFLSLLARRTCVPRDRCRGNKLLSHLHNCWICSYVRSFWWHKSIPATWLAPNLPCNISNRTTWTIAVARTALSCTHIWLCNYWYLHHKILFASSWFKDVTWSCAAWATEQTWLQKSFLVAAVNCCGLCSGIGLSNWRCMAVCEFRSSLLSSFCNLLLQQSIHVVSLQVCACCLQQQPEFKLQSQQTTILDKIWVILNLSSKTSPSIFAIFVYPTTVGLLTVQQNTVSC